MLIRLIIKFESRGFVSLGRICTPTPAYFKDKTKTSEENLEWILIYC